jgi:hypothetical protein
MEWRGGAGTRVMKDPSLLDLRIFLDVLAWLLFFVASGRYIKYAGALADFIDAYCPDLWQRLSYSGRIGIWGAARGLDRLILFNVGGRERDGDRDFRALLVRARWSAAACAFFFIGALILLAQVGDGFACRSFPEAGNTRFCPKFDGSGPLGRKDL